MRPPIRFFVKGDPKGQPRARACIRGKHAGVYDPGTANGWKHAVADTWRLQPDQGPFQCPVSIRMTFYFKRPQGHYRSGKFNGGMLKPLAPTHHTSKPDLDNLAKAVLDELTRLEAWCDDRMVCRMLVERKWANGSPGCSIEIAEADA